ncbi:MAG: radical SAM protein [Proteobacteria bacterium]|nr:radical SAM protein [Pseudomonadota bacterium]MBU0967582.1 radical SAM protein [Pseudomonadota bacterium]
MNAAPACTPARTCFGAESPRLPGKRIDLPVAARAIARLLSAPAAKNPRAMLPQEAMSWLDNMISQGADIGEAYISGPGDPLAEVQPTLETISLIRRRHADLPLGITTLGINGEQYAEALAEHGVNTVTLQVEAVDPEVVKKLYAWIRPGTKTIPLSQAAGMLVDEQQRAISALQRAGLKVTIRTTVYPGINDSQVAAIAERMGAWGAEKMILVPCTSCVNEMGSPNEPDSASMATLAKLAAQYLTTETAEQASCTNTATAEAGVAVPAAAMLPQPSAARPNVAVVSANGMDIDLHLGQATKALIYGPREDGLPCLLATRSLPEPGGGGARWEKLADSFTDCFALLTSGAGDNPRKVLAGRGITVLITDGNVEGTVDVLYGGGKKGKQCRTERRL